MLLPMTHRQFNIYYATLLTFVQQATNRVLYVQIINLTELEQKI